VKNQPGMRADIKGVEALKPQHDAAQPQAELKPPANAAEPRAPFPAQTPTGKSGWLARFRSVLPKFGR
jgi:hypothetical protein